MQKRQDVSTCTWTSRITCARSILAPAVSRPRTPGCCHLTDPLLRRSVCAAGQPACSQVRRRIRVSASDRKSPPLTGRSGTQRARRPGSRTTAGTSAPWSSSSSSELRITRVFSCVARGFKARPSFMFAGCCWWRSLAIDGGSGTSRGHRSVMRRPGSQWTALSNNLPLFRPDISPVDTDRARVLRCRWSLVSAVGCCFCCHRCCQPLVLFPSPRSPRRRDRALPSQARRVIRCG